MALNLYITVDAEIWPAVDDRWPRLPLATTQDCAREIDAYFQGRCRDGSYGLPYQLEVLARYGLRATYFVDPMFSFALGLEPLRGLVALIQGHGQRVELHLHPEWLTDPRCPPLPEFRGPHVADYDEETQYRLICIARDRLLEAGAGPLTVFRAGNWGASRATLRALERAGIRIDASLNACHEHSLPDLPRRLSLQSPRMLEGVTELPLTRFDDGVSRLGRPLSLVGVSLGEMCHVLDRMHASAAEAAVIVLHGNEFVRTENLRRNRPASPRRLVVRRFEALCRHLSANASRFTTRYVGDVTGAAGNAADAGCVQGDRWRTSLRMIEQAVSRWY